jgi:HAMP domain-containing protein
MTERLQQILRDAANEPNTEIGALARTSNEQHSQLLSSFNAELE